MTALCPVPNCDQELSDPAAYVCTQHYFAVDPQLMRRAVRMRFQLPRAKTDYQRQAMADQVLNFKRLIVEDAQRSESVQ